MVSTDGMLTLPAASFWMLGDAWAAPRIQCWSSTPAAPLTDSGCAPCPPLLGTHPGGHRPGCLQSRSLLMQPLLQVQKTRPHSRLGQARLQRRRQAMLLSAQRGHRSCTSSWRNAGPTGQRPTRRWPQAGQGCGRRRRRRTGKRLWRSSARQLPLSRPPPCTKPTVIDTAGMLMWHRTGVQCRSLCLVMCAAAGLLRDGGAARHARPGWACAAVDRLWRCILLTPAEHTHP